MNKDFAFKIANIKISNELIMAPMDGYTDLPFRKIVKKLGAGIVYSEFINGLDVINKHPYLEQKIKFTEDERPFAYQIFDDSPERILETALILEKNRPDFIDVNLGCSAKNVANRGAGSGLLLHPEKIKLIISLLVKNLSVPVTAKIRLGWDEKNLNYLDVSKIIQDYGASMIAVHARTKAQGYSGEANWNAIAEIKSKLMIPVIANGDVTELSHIQKIKKLTKCDGVMIGRGALSNPWIFQGRDIKDVSIFERITLVNEHFDKVLKFYGHRSGMILFRKHIKNYFNVSVLSKEERVNLYTQNNPDKFKHLLISVMQEQLQFN